jgi:hypothetical protein
MKSVCGMAAGARAGGQEVPQDDGGPEAVLVKLAPWCKAWGLLLTRPCRTLQNLSRILELGP